jgi:hypothetical protein
MKANIGFCRHVQISEQLKTAQGTRLLGHCGRKLKADSG